MKEQLSWKLVRDDARGIRSLTGHWRVAYKVGAWTLPAKKAVNQFLFVFNTREAARQYQAKNSMYKFKIYRCEVKNMSALRPGRAVSGRAFNGLDGYWPKGTRFADEVKLIYKA